MTSKEQIILGVLLCVLGLLLQILQLLIHRKKKNLFD